MPGNIGIASQSGAFGTHIGALARDRRIGCSILMTTGNEADITVADAIAWMAQNDSIDVICTYMEAINDGSAFLAALDVARACGKPVFALKAGRSALGARAAASHTASLTGDAMVADVVLTDHGAVMVRDPETMMDFAYAAGKKVFPKAHSLGVITISGGAGIVISDEAERIGLPMPAMPSDAQSRLSEVLPYSSPINPLDCTAQALNEPELLEIFSRAALEHGKYGAVLCFLTYVAGSPAMSDVFIKALRPLRKEFPNRIIAICALGAPDVLKAFDDEGILVFNDPCRAARAIDAICRIGVKRAAPIVVDEVSEIIPIALPEGNPDEAAAKKTVGPSGHQCCARIGRRDCRRRDSRR